MSRSQKWILILLSVLLSLLVFLSTASGTVGIPLNDIITILTGGTAPNSSILLSVRLPRIVLSLIIGINLALSGLIFQAVLRNPLADPGIIGVSAGASLAAVLIMLIFPGHIMILTPVSFLGGFLTFLLIITISWKNSMDPSFIILTGVAVNIVLRGIQSVIVIMNSDKLHNVVFWLNGNLSGNSWKTVGTVFLISVPVWIMVFLIRRKMNLLILGDRNMQSLGVDVRKLRLSLASLGVILAAVSVSTSGFIGFVGLIVPHIGRIIVGNDNVSLVPYTLILGPIVLLLADTLARTMASPLEIPVGTVMSVMGGPFFLILLYRKNSMRRKEVIR